MTAWIGLAGLRTLMWVSFAIAFVLFAISFALFRIWNIKTIWKEQTWLSGGMRKDENEFRILYEEMEAVD